MIDRFELADCAGGAPCECGGTSPFYALLFRSKYINRWGLMKNTRAENLAEHGFACAVIAHALALIGNTYFHRSYDADKALVCALYHDTPEIYTGDLPTPVKYYNPEIRRAYKDIEAAAADKLLSLLPEELLPAYKDALNSPLQEILPLVKAADKLCAYIKCIEEAQSGNREFTTAQRTLRAAITAMHLPEAEYFMKHFLPAFGCTLDEQEASI